MLVKSSIAAVAVIAAAVSLSRIDYRDLYNEMYPVNGLKRGVLDLCHEAKPTFIRAVREDRINCYDSMPDNIEMAIGWVRTSERLAALRRALTPLDTAERMLSISALSTRRLAAPQFPGYLQASPQPQPCAPNAAAAPSAGSFGLRETDEQLARHIAKGGDDPLAQLGLKPGPIGPDRSSAGAVPVLPLAPATEAANGATTPASGSLSASPATAAGCKTRDASPWPDQPLGSSSAG